MSFNDMQSGNKLPMSEINVTPMVDVMLVLLIVFMITMPVLTHTIPIALPTTSTQQAVQDEPTEPLRLTVDIAGNYYLGEQKTSIDDLQVALQKAKNANSNLILAIDGDKSVDYEAIVRALNVAKDVGITKVGFVTETTL